MEGKTGGKSDKVGMIFSAHRTQSTERRQLPRLSLGTEQFRLAEYGKIFSVNDLSEKGMGLRLLEPTDLQYFSVGLLLKGTLNLKREKYDLNARVRNLAGDRVGCEFEDLEPAVSQVLSEVLHPVKLGAALKLIPSGDMNSLWYHGSSGTDLILKRTKEDGPFQKFMLYALNTFIQWDAQEGLTTGRTTAADEKSETRGVVRLEAWFLEPDRSPDSEKLSVAKTIILSSNLSQDLKTWCTDQLKR